MPTRRQLLAASVAFAGLPVLGVASVRRLTGFRRIGESWTDAWLRALGELEAGDTLVLPAETMVVEAPLVIGVDGIEVKAPPGAMLRAAPGTSFEYLLSAVGRRGVTVTGLSLDVNQAQRRGVQRHRFMGLGLDACAECTLSGIAVRGTLGYDGIPAAAIAIAGEGRGVSVSRVTLEACGTALQPSDGLYMSGDDHVATRIAARGVTDTAVVLEACNRSRIHDVDVRDGSAAAAVTNITPYPKRGNAITGIVGRNLNAPVTGWVQVGCPVASVGDLLDTVIAADLSVGPGPGINVRHVGQSRARGVSLSGTIAGAGAQGILVDGSDVTITADVGGSGAAGIQFQPGSSGRVTHSRVTGGTFGVLVARDADVTTSGNTYQDQRFWNMFVYRGGRLRSDGDRFGSAGIDHHGHEPGATLQAS